VPVKEFNPVAIFIKSQDFRFSIQCLKQGLEKLKYLRGCGQILNSVGQGHMVEDYMSDW